MPPDQADSEEGTDAPATEPERSSPRAPRPRRELRVFTLNVHGWHNEESGAWDALVAMLAGIGADVIALQEATKHRVPALAKALGGLNWTARHNCAILSRFALGELPADHTAGTGLRGAPGRKQVKADRSLRFCAAQLTPAEGAPPLVVACLHLDHVRETTRLGQLRAVAEQLEQLGPSTSQIWLGDFNALTRADWHEQEWARLAEHRARNAWEAPVSDLTSLITSPVAACEAPQARARGRPAAAGLGFTDCWRAAAERSGPLGTSRFKTRIDYVYVSPAMAAGAAVARCQHVQTIPHVSDHNAVLATLELR